MQICTKVPSTFPELSAAECPTLLRSVSRVPENSACYVLRTYSKPKERLELFNEQFSTQLSENEL